MSKPKLAAINIGDIFIKVCSVCNKTRYEVKVVPTKYPSILGNAHYLEVLNKCSCCSFYIGEIFSQTSQYLLGNCKHKRSKYKLK